MKSVLTIGTASLLINFVILLQEQQFLPLILLIIATFCLISYKKNKKSDENSQNPEKDQSKPQNQENRQKQRHLLPKNLRNQDPSTLQSPNASNLGTQTDERSI